MKRMLILSAVAAILCGGCSSQGADQAGEKVAPVAVTETSDAAFKQDVISSKQPVLIDFYATWCGPCRMMSPVVDEVASQYRDKIKVFKVDVDKNPKLATVLRIDSIPTLAVFKNGLLVTSSAGYMSKEALAALVENSISQ